MSYTYSILLSLYTLYSITNIELRFRAQITDVGIILLKCASIFKSLLMPSSEDTFANEDTTLSS